MRHTYYTPMLYKCQSKIFTKTYTKYYVVCGLCHNTRAWERSATSECAPFFAGKMRRNPTKKHVLLAMQNALCYNRIYGGTAE